MPSRLGLMRRRLEHAIQDLKIEWAYARNGVRSRPSSDREQSLVLTTSDLIEAGYPLSLDRRFERFVTREYPDGAIEVKYSYEPEEAEPGFIRFMLVSRIERSASAQAAAELLRDAVGWAEAGMETVGGRLVFKGNLQTWCDNAHLSFTLAKPNDTVVGSRLSFQRERMVFFVTLRGIVLDEEQEVEKLVYPFLERGREWCAGEA